MEPYDLLVIRLTGSRPSGVLQLANPNPSPMAFKVSSAPTPRHGAGRH